jgi:uncharacterized glyoxalase superfamily protein PhnB
LPYDGRRAMNSLPEGEIRMSFSESLPTFYHTVPALACRDLEETLSYYRDILGFDEECRWGDPPSNAIICRDHMKLFLSEDPDLANRIRGQEILLFVDEIEQIYEEHTECGADIITDVREEPWGTREYTIRDNNGYCLRISESVDNVA